MASVDADPVSEPRKVEEVARQLTRGKLDMAHRAAAWIRKELQSYQPVSEDALLASVQLNLQRSVATLIEGTVPTSEDAENRVTTRERMDVGVPIGDIIRGYRISLTVIYEEFQALAGDAGMTADEILDGSRLLWQLGDWFTAGAAAEYRYNAAQGAVRQALEHADLVRRLISEGPWPRGFEGRLRESGLDIDLDYTVRMMSHEDGPGAEKTPGLPNIAGGLAANVDGRTVAIVPATSGPIGTSEDQRWAVGPPAPLRKLHESATVVERILRSLPRNARGLYTASDLGWRLILPLDRLTSDALTARYLEPLRPDSPGGAEILQTVTLYLEQGRNVRRTAEVMIVHQNTVRYRLERFENLTGESLDDPDVLVDLAMILDIRLRRPRSAG